MKDGVINRDVSLRFIDDSFLFVRITLTAGFDRERNKYAINFLVITEIGLDFHLGALFNPLCQNPDLKKMIRIEVNEIYIPIFAYDF